MTAEDTLPKQILIVVVLYRTKLARSRTVQGLAQAAAALGSFDVLLWDNSPEPLQQSELPFAATYHHAGQNEGVAGAYNGAMQVAQQRGHAWLLLLDDDTSVTPEFLDGVAAYAEPGKVAADTIAAVVPFLYAGGRQVSPQLWHFARHQPLPRPARGYAESRPVFAANSGVLLRVAALAAVGGYNARFWLDYSDIELFHRLHLAGYSVWVAPELRLQHEIAMLDYDARMSPERYGNYLAAEGDFVDLYRGPAERALYLARLAVRVFRQRRYRSAAYSQMTRAALLRRLHTSAARRLSSSQI